MPGHFDPEDFISVDEGYLTYGVGALKGLICAAPTFGADEAAAACSSLGVGGVLSSGFDYSKLASSKSPTQWGYDWMKKGFPRAIECQPGAADITSGCTFTVHTACPSGEVVTFDLAGCPTAQ
jgi:hypothetical protein